MHVKTLQIFYSTKRFYSITFLIFFACFAFGFWFKNIQMQEFDPVKSEQIFQHSSYAPNPEDRWYPMEDWDLYAYAGYKYVTTFQLDQTNIEHPPLGKYFIGLSILLTGSPSVISLFWAIILLWLVWLLSYLVIGNLFLSFLPPFLLLYEELFWEQVSFSMLDLPQLVFIVLFLILAHGDLPIKNIDNIRYWGLLGVVLGCIAAIKFPAATVVLLISFAIALFFTYPNDKQILRADIKKKGLFSSWQFHRLFFVSCIALGVYLLCYLPLFISHGPDGFVRNQISSLKIQVSHLPNYPWGGAFKALFLNQWLVWFDPQNPVWKISQWWWVWFVSGIALMGLPFYLGKKMIEKKTLPLWAIFACLEFIFLNTRVFFPRYLFILFPFAFIAIGQFIRWVYKEVISK